MGSQVVLATAGYDHTIRFWEATSGICYRTLQYADSQVSERSIFLLRRQRRRRRRRRKKNSPCINQLTRLSNSDSLSFQVNKLEITADKQLLAAGGNPHVSGNYRAKKQREREIFYYVALVFFSFFSLIPSTPGEKKKKPSHPPPHQIRLFEVNSSNPQPVLSYDGHGGNVTALGFQRDGKWMFSGSEDGTLRLWDLRAPGCQREYASRAPVNAVALHPNQGELISGDAAGNIRVWDLTAGACSCELVPEVGTAVRSLSVAADGGLVVAANSAGTCYVWRAARGGGGHVSGGGRDDGSVLGAGGGGGMAGGEGDANNGGGCSPPRAPPPSAGGGGPATPPPSSSGSTATATHFEPLHKLRAHPGRYVLKALLSPDARQLATAASDRTVKLWDVDNGFALERTLRGHARWVWDCVFSVDGAYLVTASSDCTGRLWDLATGDAIRVYSGHHKAAVCCALNDSAIEGREGE